MVKSVIAKKAKSQSRGETGLKGSLIEPNLKKETRLKGSLIEPIIIEETFSLCPICLERIPANKVAYGSRVYLEKNCAKHGKFKTLLWQGKPKYENWRRQELNAKPAFHNTESLLGCPYDCGICTEHKQDICCVLLNLTQRCNQHCSFCFADSGELAAQPDLTMAEIEGIYDSLIEKNRENPYNIQLSGGEPTLRDDLPEIIALGKAKGFKYIQLNSNGKKLGENPAYAKQLKAAGLDCVYLQFDGMNDDVINAIRGENLLKIKKQAVKNCGAAEIGVVLVMTLVPKLNVEEIGPTLDYALANLPAVRGISLQPVSYFGRFPKAPTDEMRLTLPQIIGELESQSNGRLHKKDFVPLVSGDCYCSFHGNFVVMPDDSIVGISSEGESCCCSKDQAIIQARNFIAKKFSAKANHGEILENYNFDSWDLFIKQMDNRGFCITCEAFQDVWNFDVLRTQKCRLYVATPDQNLIPFCVYNLTDAKGRFLYGGRR